MSGEKATKRGPSGFAMPLRGKSKILQQQALQWRADRESEYTDIDGWRRQDAVDQSWDDAWERYFKGDKPRDSPRAIERVEIPDNDRRLKDSEKRKREKALLADTRFEQDRNGDPNWPFLISKEDAAQELVEGEGRTTAYGERLEWVSQHMDRIDMTPAGAPCNASWSLLWFAVRWPDKFYAQQKQHMSKADTDGEEERQLDADLNRFDRFFKKFEGFNRIDQMVASGELKIYEGQ